MKKRKHSIYIIPSLSWYHLIKSSSTYSLLSHQVQEFENINGKYSIEVPDFEAIAALKTGKGGSKPSSSAGSPAPSKSQSAAPSPAPDRTDSPQPSGSKPLTPAAPSTDDK